MGDDDIHESSPQVEIHPDRIHIESPPKQSRQGVTPDSDVGVGIESSPVVVEKRGDTEIDQNSSGNTTTVVNSHDVIHSHAKKDGFQNSVKFITFLGKMMIPMAVMAVLMFGIFSLMSWLIPHVLCKSFGEELSGSSIGIYECVYNSDGNYRYLNARKVFWLIFWSIQTAWVALFPGYIAYTLFGTCVTVAQLAATAIVAAGCFATPMVTALAYGMALNNFIVLGVSAGGSFLVNVICASAAVRYTKDRIMKWRWITLFLIAGQVNTVYLFVLPRILTLTSSQALGGMGLTVIRIFVHPVIWAGVLFMFRSVQRHIGHVENLKQISFLVWPVLYATLYGRFLLLQLEDVGSIIMMNFLLACVSIGIQLQGRGSDSLWLGWMYGKRARDAMEVSMDVDEYALAQNFSIFAMEMASILSASSLLTFGAVASIPGVPPNTRSIWVNAIAQLATTIVFSSFEFTFGKKFHNFEWEKVYPRSVYRLLAYVLPVLVIGGSRLCVELLLLFCPKHYDEYGILLEQCDKDNLFQHINMTSFLSRPPIQGVSGPWFEFGRAEL